ncbi:MAG: type IV pilin N-terminal domain-containing protein [Thermoplasmata archaeon]|nr:MAG: type IV pilin N-terminal domain-containing protein [Thermoplasmata archaeon]
MRKIWRYEEGVSPVIAVILMVGITVVLAAVLYVMVSGMMTSTNITPNVSMHWVKGDPGEYTGSVVSISGQQKLRLEDVTLTATVDGMSDANTLDWFVEGTNEMTIGNFTLDFFDNNKDNRLGGDDDFVVTGGEKGDIIRLIYNPTSGQMVSHELR